MTYPATIFAVLSPFSRAGRSAKTISIEEGSDWWSITWSFHCKFQIQVLGWCSWLSRVPHTHEVPSSILGLSTCFVLFRFFCCDNIQNSMSWAITAASDLAFFFSCLWTKQWHWPKFNMIKSQIYLFFVYIFKRSLNEVLNPQIRPSNTER